MKKLEDIPKKNIFEVPEGYFDRLPSVIQARVAQQASESVWAPFLKFSLRYALPVVVLGAVAIWFYGQPSGPQNAEDMLSSVDTSQLVAYLEDSDLTTDDLLEGVDLDEQDANEIQGMTFDEIGLAADGELLEEMEEF